MISYSQNAEDVVLARALPAASGFYVDVGAGHPDIASVTKHFYELGWRGINIEPRSDAVALLEQQRPRDINLCMAAGSFEGTVDLHIVEGDPDLSTIDRDDLDYLRDRGYGFRDETVPVRTLNSILEEHNVATIDFLKIDVEGSEADVIAGIDLVRWAPTVIVVESILPWSRERTDASWRTMLESQGYREASFDGINLFFAASDDIAAALAPASVLDDYETADAAATRKELDRLREYITKLDGEIARYNEWETELTDYVRKLESELGTEDVAPLIDLNDTRKRQLPSRSSRPLAAPRLAIVGTPQTGDDWIRTVLADVLDAKELPVRHPADVDWAGLPDRFVLQLHWKRSQYLERTLREQGIVVISAARQPIDVLLSLLTRAQIDGDEEALRGLQPGDRAFLDWATSPRAGLLLSLTPEWWSTPATHRVRFEELTADPHGEVVSLLARCEVDARKDPNAVVEEHRAPPDTEREGLPAEYVDALLAAHRDVFLGLGYDLDG